jgi:hypothetical protein
MESLALQLESRVLPSLPFDSVLSVGALQRTERSLKNIYIRSTVWVGLNFRSIGSRVLLHFCFTSPGTLGQVLREAIYL